MAAPQEFMVAYPDLITQAIKLLAGAVVILTTALVAVMLYIWHDHKGKMQDIANTMQNKFESISSEFKEEIKSVAKSLETISCTLFDRQRIVEQRLCEQETRCEERHNGRRKGDYE
jgi:hypothetical protein